MIQVDTARYFFWRFVDEDIIVGDRRAVRRVLRGNVYGAACPGRSLRRNSEQADQKVTDASEDYEECDQGEHNWAAKRDVLRAHEGHFFAFGPGDRHGRSAQRDGRSGSG